MFDLSGKIALVVGGAGYLGSAICRAYAECHARLVIADWNEERLDALVKELERTGAQARAVCLDCTDSGRTAHLMQSIKAREGSLDILVNATYNRTNKSVEDLTEEEFNRANEVNITSMFTLARQATELLQSGSSIILFSTMYGTISPNPSDYQLPVVPNPIEYGAGKAAINQMTRYMASWLGPRAIRVNAIAPGSFPWNVKDNEAFMEKLRAKSVLHRVGIQHEIAGAAVFLASDEASFVTGHILAVDGGSTIW